MKISFFEEFPTPANLKKLALLPYKPKLYLAAPNVPTFQHLTHGLKCAEDIFWPVVKKEDGYWLSPFSPSRALSRLFHDFRTHTPPLFSAPPFPLRTSLLVTSLPSALANLWRIRSFLSRYPAPLYAGEYSVEPRPLSFLLGVPSRKGMKHVKMLYSSLHKGLPFKQLFEDHLKTHGHDFIPALGLLAPGIHGSEQILSPTQLRQDLEMCQGADEVILFRLGGLNQKYLTVIEKFL